MRLSDLLSEYCEGNSLPFQTSIDVPPDYSVLEQGTVNHLLASLFPSSQKIDVSLLNYRGKRTIEIQVS